MTGEENNRKLYPMRFIPQEEKTEWGSERYLLADLGYKDSVVENGWFVGNTLSELMGTYLERVVGDEAFEYYGLQFPVMLKEILLQGRTPLLLNVDDDTAAQRYDSFGKTAAWYVRKAGKGAKIWLGFKRDLTPEAFYRRCREGSVEEVLHAVEPCDGEIFLLRPGMVYAAEGEQEILEVAESSDLALCLHNWGMDFPEGEESMLEEAFDLIDFRKYSPPPAGTASQDGSAVPLVSVPEFTVSALRLDDPLRVNNGQPGNFTVYHCLSGEVSVQVPAAAGEVQHAESCLLKKGCTLLVPAEVETFYLVPVEYGTRLLDVIVDQRTARDLYLDR